MTTPAFAEAITLTQWDAIQSRQRPSRGEESVIYYRKPNYGKYAGWITHGDSQPSKQLDLISRGFEALRLQDPSGRGVIRIVDSQDFWGPILRHPNGPEQFPVNQILTYRWYKFPPVQGVRFPQLRAWIDAGNEIVEYACPECDSPVEFHMADHLARHLRSAHRYDRMEVTELGKQIGIDFAKVARVAGRQVYAYDLAEVAPLPQFYQTPDPDPVIAVKSIKPQARGPRPVPGGLPCPKCGKVLQNPGALAAHLRRRDHQKEEVTVVEDDVAVEDDD